KYPERFPAVAALAPAIEHHELYGQGSPLDELYDSKEQCRQDTVPMHVQPGRVPPHLFFASDPGDEFWFRGGDRLREKLAALGVEHEADLATRAGGRRGARAGGPPRGFFGPRGGGGAAFRRGGLGGGGGGALVGGGGFGGGGGPPAEPVGVHGSAGASPSRNLRGPV